MVTTQAFIGWIKKRIGNGLPETELLEVINNVQNEVLGMDMRLMRIRPEPFLATTASNNQFTINGNTYSSVGGVQGSVLTEDIRRVARVYSYSDNLGTVFHPSIFTGNNPRPNQIQKLPSSNIVEASCDLVDSIVPDDDLAKVIFWEDFTPGDTTTEWRLEAYKWPTQLTSQNIQMSIPAQFWTTLVFWGVMRDIQYTGFGSVGESVEAFEKYFRDFKSYCDNIVSPEREDDFMPPRDY